jgi:undecaprenyl-diphosphatase
VIDVAVHVGTLGAVILYFWRDVKLGLSGIPRMLTGRIDTPGSKLAFLLAIATVPVIVAGPDPASSPAWTRRCAASR